MYVQKKNKKTFKPLARNNHTGRSFALACPYVRARTCVTVRANQKKRKTFKQPHRPFLRCRKRRLDWGIVFKKIEKVQKSRKKEYSKSINREKIEKEYSKSSLSRSPEVKSSLSGSSHIAVTIIYSQFSFNGQLFN